ncbi:DNA polymerase III PolC-type [bioreactor metagenome]|uniref:DNA polymerase III PolC-type n=1 Tax=bioreactor metagenome TaxID=1076179 RepID=A0A645DND0_9ZZZZ
MIENGKLTDRREWLIRPHRSLDWLLPQFTDIHGIDYYQLRGCPEFCEVWTLMANFIHSGDLVVIHNASFDLAHLRAVLGLYKLPSFSFEYVCSLRLCRQLFPEMESHSLDKMAERFQLAFTHHDALEDATVCASIVSHTGIPENSRKRFEYCAQV